MKPTAMQGFCGGEKEADRERERDAPTGEIPTE